MDEHLHFRVDLHPDQVIIQENGKLAFIDFSSVGSLNKEKQIAVQQIMKSAVRRDPLEMAHESMVLLEPLPPIDTIKFTRDLEAFYWKFLYAFESKQIEWWERTTARLWLGFIRVASDHTITLSIHILRMIRSNLLYDVLAARLFPKIDHLKEYQKFVVYRGKLARKRMEKRLRNQLKSSADNRLFLDVENLTKTSQRLYRQVQRFLSKPEMKINAVLGKSVYSLAVLFRLLGQTALVTGIMVAIIAMREWMTHEVLLQFSEALMQAFSNRIYQIIIAFLILVNVRTMLFRMSDMEV